MRYEVLYDIALRSGRYDHNPRTPEPIYGLPHPSRAVPPDGAPRYRGIDREPLEALSFFDAEQFAKAGTPCEANEATNLLAEIESSTGREDGWVTAFEHIRQVWEALGENRDKYEVIFAREQNDYREAPQNAEFMGCDAAYFMSDYFSCLCDALFIPRWHGTDPEGLLFREHFAKLNRNGLFNSDNEALDYLQYYLSFDWTERSDDFTSIQVFTVRIENISDRSKQST